MQTHLTSTRTVIEKLGGIQAVADLTGRKYNAVQNWQSFGAFPSATYLVIKAELEARDCTAPDSLWRMVEPADRVSA